MAAEAVVSFAVERIGDPLIKKIVFLKGVQGQVERLQDELVRMQNFLKDADQKKDEDERIRNWVSEIRAAAYDSEDVIENFICKFESLEKKGFLRKLVCYPTRVYFLNKLGKDIESLQERIKNIPESRPKYGIRNLGEGTSTQAEERRQLRRSSPFIEKKDAVGLKDKTDCLVAQLLKQDKRRSVVSIIGMGGVGKTTLAKEVYNHADVKAHFNCCAWVCVSESYKVKHILEMILKQVKTLSNDLLELLKNMQDEDLEQFLHRELQDKCYLVVLDDVWQEEAWDCLARAFLDAENGSRVLLTSRYRNVAVHADALSFPYELKILDPEESWQLFVREASGDGLDIGLEDIGREITRRCDGLPLAITVIGGLLLGKKKLKSEWKKVLDNINTYLSRSTNGVLAILELSYADLPPHLKLCFLYLGLFPEDFKIDVRKLIHLWTAEGIIQNREARLEDLAEYYLEELINRNMVQVAATTFDERITRCQIHDLLRELAIKKSKDENFLQIHWGSAEVETTVKARHLAVHCPSTSDSFHVSGKEMPHLRTLLFISGKELLHLRNVRFISNHIVLSDANLFFKSLKLLRVLDLEGVCIGCLPKEIGRVRLLRYLNLRRTGIEELPRSLSRLRRLQTLDLRGNFLNRIPNILWKLENLRHIFADLIRGEIPIKVEGLRNLQTLSRIHVDDLIHSHLCSLISLRKLGIEGDDKSTVDKIFPFLAKLGNLQSLKLYFLCSRRVASSSLDGLSDLCYLNELKLGGRISHLPRLPPNISRLHLLSTLLEEDPMPILGELRSLSFLRLNVGAYRGSRLTIPKNGFHQLKFLELIDLFDLEEIEMEEGAMTELRSLRINSCLSLKRLSTEAKYMTSLEKVELADVPESFFREVQVLVSGRLSEGKSRHVSIIWDTVPTIHSRLTRFEKYWFLMYTE